VSLLDDIIALAVNDKGSIATLLRKCPVLAHQLKNERLKAWAEKELNGYEANDELPVYRKTAALAKGHFLGSFGSQISHQPIPTAALKKEHRHFAESVELTQPIVAYETISHDAHMVFDWPPNLTLLYQREFFEGKYNLNRAWPPRAAFARPSNARAGPVFRSKSRCIHARNWTRPWPGAPHIYCWTT